MGVQFIRVKRDGFIYEYSELMARNPECEVISEELAYPERFIPQHVMQAPVESAKGAKRAPRKAALVLTTDDIPEPPVYTAPELAAEASRGLPA